MLAKTYAAKLHLRHTPLLLVSKKASGHEVEVSTAASLKRPGHGSAGNAADLTERRGAGSGTAANAKDGSGRVG